MAGCARFTRHEVLDGPAAGKAAVSGCPWSMDGCLSQGSLRDVATPYLIIVSCRWLVLGLHDVSGRYHLAVATGQPGPRARDAGRKLFISKRSEVQEHCLLGTSWFWVEGKKKKKKKKKETSRYCHHYSPLLSCLRRCDWRALFWGGAWSM